MPFIKISGLTTATAVSATNQFEINQNGGSRSATVAQVAAFARTSATDPVVLPAGTVSAPALTFTGDTNTGIYSPAADTIAFTEGGVEAVRITPSGEFLVGTSTPAGRIASIGGSNIGVYATSTANHAVFGDGLTTGFYGVYGASTNTSYGGVIGYHNSYNAFGILGYLGYGLYSNASIWVNGTVYTSDARLKENVAPLEGSLAKVAALNPVSFEWKENSFRGASSDFGLIAQEVEQVIPECVFETVVPQRTPEMSHAPTLEEELGTYKGVDYSRFIPLLIAAVKELKSENDALKARVASLENK